MKFPPQMIDGQNTIVKPETAVRQPQIFFGPKTDFLLGQAVVIP